MTQWKFIEESLLNVLPLTKEEATHLFQAARQMGDPGELAKIRLIESHLHLVLPVAERHASSGLSVLDLIQEGNLGLFRAVDEFPNSNLRDFQAFAVVCIEDAISTAIEQANE